ncbi:uncharacterized protein LOC143025331 isoform X2 [Oratosquilla oratoria]|uniref:uncharacterized protein LOC143025331 isoform X2 n=1 Tax=Oratosquilla oratoria TaxID=337810 RepID=UPI003F75C293
MNPSLSKPSDKRRLTSAIRTSIGGKSAPTHHSAMGVVAVVIVVVVVMGAVVAGGTGVEALTPPEIKTLALPPVEQTEEPITYKDCQVFRLGELHGVKRHGETWDNDEASDCERCFCYNGVVRCYYHYCNVGLTEEYMTPPSAETHHPPDGGKVPRVGGGTGAAIPSDDESDEEESSGVEPDDLANPFLTKLSKSKSPKEPGWEGQRVDLDLGEERRAGEKDPWDNETYDDRHDDLYDLLRHQVCQDSCKKTCAHGFDVDPKNGCTKCKCFKCLPLDTCVLKCPHGFAHDNRLCPMCKCRHIKFVDTLLEGDVIDKYKSAKEDSEEKQGKDMDNDDGMVTKNVEEAETKFEIDHIEFETSAWPTQEPSPGCMEGDELYSVGAVWSPSPCVMCRCVTPDYKECNVTQCAPLTCQPHHQHTPPQMCCPICTDRPHIQAHEQYRNESHSTSRIPDDLVLAKPHKAHESSGHHTRHGEGERLKGVPAGNGTLRSALPGSSEFWWWQLFVPMAAVAVLASIVTAVAVYVWRRYHRDKYYITAGRPDETERLRPVPVRIV